MKKHEAIKSYLDSLTPGELITVHNKFIDTICIQDYFIYSMEMFNEVHEDVPPLDIARDCVLGGFNHKDAYFWTDMVGNIHSSNHPEVDCVKTDEIARHIIEEEDDLGIPELGDILGREV